LFLTGAVLLGTYLGLQYLRGNVRKPGLIAAHLLLGAAGLELTAMLLRGTPSGDVTPAGRFGTVAAGLLAVAMGSGFAAPLLGPRSRQTANLILGTHAGLGALGFVLFLFWVANL
jgi:hypothetical protein